MSAIVWVFLALMAGLAALAARRGERSSAIAAGVAAVVVVGLALGGYGTVLAWGGVLIAAAAVLSWLLRAGLAQVVPVGFRGHMGRAPLTAVFGMAVIVVYALAAIFAPLVAPYGEAEIVSQAFAPPGDGLLLGADQIGRDLFSRLIYGARNTVGLALAATTIAFVLGAAAGLWAAVKGGWFDQLMGRIVDVLMSVPSLILALLILSITGTNLVILALVVAAIYAPRVFRLTRAVAGGIVVMDYVEAARLRGEGDGYLIRREVLPNAQAPLVAEFGLEFCFVFLLIAGLSFLGLGIQPPTADWGSMVRESATLISFGEITPLVPAAAIALLTVAVNFVVDWVLALSSGLRDMR